MGERGRRGKETHLKVISPPPPSKNASSSSSSLEAEAQIKSALFPPLPSTAHPTSSFLPSSVAPLPPKKTIFFSPYSSGPRYSYMHLLCMGGSPRRLPPWPLNLSILLPPRHPEVVSRARERRFSPEPEEEGGLQRKERGGGCFVYLVISLHTRSNGKEEYPSLLYCKALYVYVRVQVQLVHRIVRCICMQCITLFIL